MEDASDTYIDPEHVRRGVGTDTYIDPEHMRGGAGSDTYMDADHVRGVAAPQTDQSYIDVKPESAYGVKGDYFYRPKGSSENKSTTCAGSILYCAQSFVLTQQCISQGNDMWTSAPRSTRGRPPSTGES